MGTNIRNLKLIRKQKKAALRQAADSVLRGSRSKKIRVPSLVEAVDRGEDNYLTPFFKELHNDGERKAFRRILLACVANRMKWVIDPRSYSIGTGSHHCANPRMKALQHVASWHCRWVGEPETWKNNSHNPDRQFGHLARHLLANYRVPMFMDKVWFEDHNTKQQGWFVHIGQGGNIRKADDIPIPLTKKMAVFFLRAPENMGVMPAFRWSQVLGLGGSDRTATAIVGSRIGSNFASADFWTTVVHFFINNPMLDPSHVGPIIDYIENQKFVGQGIVLVDGRAQLRGAPHPGFSMKGRTVDTLLRGVDIWHRELGSKGARRFLKWQSCGIPGLELQDGKKDNLQIYTIRELLNSGELSKEGREMSHCVGSYAGSCQSGLKAIYSLTEQDATGLKHRLTISVDPRSLTITEARKKANSLPNQVDRRILSQWMSSARLRWGVWGF